MSARRSPSGFGAAPPAWVSGRAGEPLTPGEGARRLRKWLVGYGVIALILGVLAVAVPIIASVAIAVFVGWVLLAAGIVMGTHAIADRSALRGLEALLTLLAGLYILVFPLSGTVTLTFVLAVWFFASGMLSLTFAVELRGTPQAWMTGINGALSVILGILIAASLPSSAAWAIGLLVGLNLIFSGVRALVAAQRLAAFSTAEPEPSRPPSSPAAPE